MTKQLDRIQKPEDLQALSVEELGELAREIREFITQSVSQTGGHLASNLGVVELTIAMHRVFDFKTDRLLWDVGHQCYAHKILTGRKAMFDKLRQEDGLSGFPNPDESPYDVFRVGHAGTSIATALGMALGAQHRSTEEKIVALVGDASIVNGLSFEALNNLGLCKRQMLIILNDILDISKIEAGKITIEKIEFPINDLLWDIDSLMTIRISEQFNPLRFSITLDTPVPEHIRTDQTRLRQCLINLIGNAIKFTKKGHRRSKS